MRLLGLFLSVRLRFGRIRIRLPLLPDGGPVCHKHPGFPFRLLVRIDPHEKGVRLHSPVCSSAPRTRASRKKAMNAAIDAAR